MSRAGQQIKQNPKSHCHSVANNPLISPQANCTPGIWPWQYCSWYASGLSGTTNRPREGLRGSSVVLKASMAALYHVAFIAPHTQVALTSCCRSVGTTLPLMLPVPVVPEPDAAMGDPRPGVLAVGTVVAVVVVVVVVVVMVVVPGTGAVVSAPTPAVAPGVGARDDEPGSRMGAVEAGVKAGTVKGLGAGVEVEPRLMFRGALCTKVPSCVALM